ncbi:MAG: ribosomal-protein-alanine N-acetyltransferase [Ruminococcus sp.]|nr:ribosomal-protein-alanine N-acetyltransferase [Ruminococcus sp.]
MTQRADTIIRADKNTAPEIFDALSALDKSVIPDGWSAESFRSEAEKENGYVLYFPDEKSGVCALLTAYSAFGEGDITNVAVSPVYRRQGLAVRLINELERLLPDDAEEIFLEVRESNIPAISLYEKCGFERLSIRKNFYDNPCENAVVMRKSLLK